MNIGATFDNLRNEVLGSFGTIDLAYLGPPVRWRAGCFGTKSSLAIVDKSTVRFSIIPAAKNAGA
jgi:hypothetical protein